MGNKLNSFTTITRISSPFVTAEKTFRNVNITRPQWMAVTIMLKTKKQVLKKHGEKLLPNLPKLSPARKKD